MNARLNSYLKLIIAHTDDTSYKGLEEKKKSILLHLFLYLFIVTISAFIISKIIWADYNALIIGGCSFLLGGLAILLLRKKKKLLLPSIIFISLIVTISSYFFITGGVSKSGIAISLMIPLPVILILGKKRGIAVLSLFFIINSLAYYFLQHEIWFPSYSPTLAIRLAIVFLFISTMAFANEFVFELLYHKLEELSESFKTNQQRYKNLAVNKEKFLSIISHDLKDHLGSFMAISSLLNEQYSDLNEDEKQQLIKDMANISKNNFQLLHDLLKWSTVQTGNIPYKPTAFKLEKIYREVIELFNPIIEDKKLAVFLKMKSNSELFADYHMTSSILRNVVSNAIKYSHEGGEIRISAKEKADKMQITVSDKGVGMSKEDLLRFNATMSFSIPGALLEPGTGIGLILAKEFISQNEGELFIERKKDKGTKVIFTLPLVE